jgi:hypothetical protein
MSRDIRIAPASRRLLTALGILRGKIPSDAVAALQQVEQELAKSPWKDPWQDKPATGAVVLVYAKSRLFIISSYSGSWHTDDGTALGSEDIDRWMEIPEHEESEP